MKFSHFIFFSNFPKTCINLLKFSFRIHGYQQWSLSLRLLPNRWGPVPQKLHHYPANAVRSLWNDAIFWGKGPYWFPSGSVNKVDWERNKAKQKHLFTWCEHFLQVAFIQKGLMHLPFLQTDEPYYFPELEFGFFFHFKWLKSCQMRTWSYS